MALCPAVLLVALQPVVVQVVGDFGPTEVGEVHVALFVVPVRLLRRPVKVRAFYLVPEGVPLLRLLLRLARIVHVPTQEIT